MNVGGQKQVKYNREIVNKFYDPWDSEGNLSLCVIYRHLSEYTTLTLVSGSFLLYAESVECELGCEMYLAVNHVRRTPLNTCNLIQKYLRMLSKKHIFYQGSQRAQHSNRSSYISL
jgi:hypothetical protein